MVAGGYWDSIRRGGVKRRRPERERLTRPGSSLVALAKSHPGSEGNVVDAAADAAFFHSLRLAFVLHLRRSPAGGGLARGHIGHFSRPARKWLLASHI